VAAEKIRAIKKKPSILLQDNGKDAFRVSQKLAGCHLFQAQGCKGFNSFERIQRTWGQGAPWQVFTLCLDMHLDIQILRGLYSFDPKSVVQTSEMVSQISLSSFKLFAQIFIFSQ
jgi:hypothetical protein